MSTPSTSTNPVSEVAVTSEESDQVTVTWKQSNGEITYRATCIAVGDESFKITVKLLSEPHSDNGDSPTSSTDEPPTRKSLSSKSFSGNPSESSSRRFSYQPDSSSNKSHITTHRKTSSRTVPREACPCLA
ncbi:hypothetical protein BCR39DRAFT_205678 [Naematelia encephala]|uniref:Uncharacterized protein n=1 Tax=Naematelia encephala TaxID=71784 RepID=A0A1Y2B0A0_9TREE|nr:hypothetical protein BCR39DRAFT_205678 [Naematelia encephala]